MTCGISRRNETFKMAGEAKVEEHTHDHDHSHEGLPEASTASGLGAGESGTIEDFFQSAEANDLVEELVGRQNGSARR